MERLLELLLQQDAQLLAARDRSDPLRQILQDDANVVGAPKERVIDDPGRPPHSRPQARDGEHDVTVGDGTEELIPQPLGPEGFMDPATP